MKKILSIVIVALLLLPTNVKAQKRDNSGAVAAGIMAIGAGIAVMEQIKEQLEQKAVEEVLSAYPDLIDFELKTSSLKGTKMKDISRVGVVTFEIKDLKNQEKFVLFAFLSSGWTNSNGVDYNKIKWKLFTRYDWNHLMQAYIRTASKQDISLEEVSKSKIVNKGVQKEGKFIVEFSKISGDAYYTYDYSDEFKIVFNEKSLGLYLKHTNQEDDTYRTGGVSGDLVQIRRNAIIKAHQHLNYRKVVKRMTIDDYYDN